MGHIGCSFKTPMALLLISARCVAALASTKLSSRVHVRAWLGQTIAGGEMSIPTPIRTVIAADFDNDGYDEYFFNNIGASNKLIKFDPSTKHYRSMNMGPAEEPTGLGTGAAVADLDGDGVLELIIAHGESGPQPNTMFNAPSSIRAGNNYIRIMPTTRFGAPCRGCSVLLTADGRKRLKTIDAGSGYLCQMEPVAHFGLGKSTTLPTVLVTWPDGATFTITSAPMNKLHTVAFPTESTGPITRASAAPMMSPPTSPTAAQPTAAPRAGSASLPSGGMTSTLRCGRRARLLCAAQPAAHSAETIPCNIHRPPVKLCFCMVA